MNIIDIIIIALIVFVVISSAKKGFVASCLDAFSLAISGFASYKLCVPATEYMYDFFVCDLVKTEFRQALDEMSNALPIKEKILGMIESLPETAIKLLEGNGTDVHTLVNTVSTTFADDEALIESVANGVGREVMIGFLQIVVFIIMFILFTLLVRLFANFFSHNLEKLPIIGTVDTLLGGALGLVKGIVILVAASTLLYIITSTAEPGSPLEIIKTSQIYLFLLENNPIIEVIRGM